ncbi:MAG: FAD-dependent oxidoreductase [Burkholderiales bacterium]|nr:FAD-dependent oxidoreductase [Burkholderiales bacterium]
MNQLECDVAVIGAGIAGLATALRLSELGVRTLVLEQGEQEKYPCNTRIAGGAFHVAHQDVEDEPQVILDAITKRVRDSARRDLVEAMASDTRQATRWLKQHGVRFIKVGHESYRKHTLAPPIQASIRNYWEGRGGDVLLRTLEAELAKHGASILRGMRATRLSMHEGACTGVEGVQRSAPFRVLAKSVVICDGGFHADAELVREYISPEPAKLKQRNARTGNGDGLRMAREAGAGVVGMNRFYGHVLAQDAMHNDDLWPFPLMDFVCAAGVVVDAGARRFCDEGRGGVAIANSIAAQGDPLGATVIFDETIWAGPGREYLTPANPLLISRGGTLHTAPDLGGLASQLGLPRAALEQTVAQYNLALAAGQTGSLTPPRSSTSHEPHPIRTPPYHAVRLCAGITYTMGGIAIDAAGRVLNAVDQPITGLYAAGCATGGLEGGENLAYIGGLAKSTVIALRAASAIAAHLQHFATSGRLPERVT